jgi:dimethylargininase
MEFRRTFTHAVVRKLPDSFATLPEGLSAMPDMAVARKQHASYVAALEQAGLQVTSLPADEKYADCVFTEDVSVIVGDHALITCPGVGSRKGETDSMKEHLQSLGLVVMDINDPEAEIDGGDVIFTGKELLCGQSKRTNRKGLEALAAAFPGLKVVPVEVTGPLHLTTSVGFAYEDTLVVSTQTPASEQMFKSIQKNSTIPYKAIYVTDDNAANCIWINDTLICKSARECPNSNGVLTAAGPGNAKIVGLDICEIEKAVGSLTCMSLRFNPTGVLKPYTTTTTTHKEEVVISKKGYNGDKVVKNIIKGTGSERIKGY